MQITQGFRPAVGKARTPSPDSLPFVGPDLPRWHPYLSLDRDRERTNQTLRRIQAAGIQATARLSEAGRDPVREIGSVFDKHEGALRVVIAINLGSFLTECERLAEDINAL